MSIDFANSTCAGFPGASMYHPFDEHSDAWKVGDKIFALINTRTQGVSLKCQDQDTADMLIDIGQARKAPYLPRGGWIYLSFDSTDQSEISHRLRASYDKILGTLTKKRQAEIGALS